MRYVSQDRTLDQHQVTEQARRIATGFAGLGVGEGDAVGLLMANEIEFLVCGQALGFLGAYPVPISWHSTADEVAYIAGDARLTALVAHDRLADTAARGLPADVELVVVELPERTATPLKLTDPPVVPSRPFHDWSGWLARNEAWSGDPLPARPAVIYTSGTTGRPKGVVRESHPDPQARAAQSRFLNAVWGAEEGMRTLLMAPLYHSAPAAYVRAALAEGGPDGELHFMPRFDAEDALRTIERERITHMWMVPTMFVKLLQLPDEVRSRYDVSSVRNVIHSAAPCPVDLKRRMIEWLGPVINEFYGSTEVGPVTYATSEEYLAHPGTVGRVLPGCRVAVVDDAGTELQPGRVGEIAAVNTTYARFTYRNRARDRDELDAGDLIRCGDIGVLDADGFLFLRDRKKDMVISGGVNLYPAEVEDVLLQLPNVRDGAAFGIPDPVLGERMVAAVALQSPEEDPEARIAAALRERLSSTKVPRRVFVLDEFPRSENGKVAKQTLRDRVRSGESGRSVDPVGGARPADRPLPRTHEKELHP